MFHRDWCKKAVLALKEGTPVKPYHVFLSGPGGVGKSHVIKLIHSDTLKLRRLSGTFEPDDFIVLLTAPTGVAAFNINGMTLHSALLLGRTKYSGFQPLSHDKLNSLRTKLSHLMFLIIDEVSMVGSNMLLKIHKTLTQIKGVSDDVMFTANVDVSDGLVNGARDEVVYVTISNNEVTSVLVKFDNDRVGLKCIQSSQYCGRFDNAVPLSRHEVVFCARRKRGSEIKRLQFPLTLAWGTTIHKVQSLTLDEIVVDMKGGRFSPG